MVKLEFSGSGKEVRNEMLKLLGLLDSKAQTESPVKAEEWAEEISASPVNPEPVKALRIRTARKPNKSPQAVWTTEEAERLFTEIKTNAKRIIIELAKKPEGYQRSELRQALGLTVPILRGQLSSVGAALRRMGNKPSPILREKVDGELMFMLDAVVADVAKQQPIDG
jgi:hypothetical protein